jgi:dimethylamine monooxygenase subunit A
VHNNLSRTHELADLFLSDAIAPEVGQPLYLPFALGQYRFNLGLKPLSLETWIQIDNNFVPYLQQKANILQSLYSETVAGTQASQAAQQEVLDSLLEYLLAHFPYHYQRQGGAIANLKTGEVWYPSDFAEIPIDLAARLVQDDLCLMMPRKEGYLLEAASVCFPFYWRLLDKFGKTTNYIHDPVPGYESKLANPVNAYFDRLLPDAPGCRYNWSVLPYSVLALGPQYLDVPSTDDITPENAGIKLWIRVERQTLRRFPISKAILFGIHTYIYPLSILEKYPEAARGLLAAMPQVPLKIQQYKRLTELGDVIKTYVKNFI